MMAACDPHNQFRCSMHAQLPPDHMMISHHCKLIYKAISTSQSHQTDLSSYMFMEGLTLRVLCWCTP